MKNEVKEAKALLQKYGIRSIKPPQLTQAARQLNKSLLETLEIIAFLKSGEQGYGPYPHTLRAIKGKYF